MRQLNDTIIITQSGASGVNSAAVLAENLFSVSAMAVASGTEAGALKIQASNDNPVDGTAPSSWVDISGATVTVTAGGTVLIPKLDICYQYIRFVYTHSGGTGNITVKIKALGA